MWYNRREWRKGGIAINILHMKYAVEVAKSGSLNKASEVLLIAQPNLSRSIKELEADLGIAIFERTTRGMTLTPEGEEFIGYAKEILHQIEQVERYYKENSVKKQKFSVSVPHACYVSEAFADFTRGLAKAPAELVFNETDSRNTIRNLLENNYNLGVIRYAEDRDSYFKKLLEEKDLHGELITEFRYRVLVSEENPLAKKDTVTLDDLCGLIEIAHDDPTISPLTESKDRKDELSDHAERRIYVSERGSRLELLQGNPETFLWVSLVPRRILERYGLAEKVCVDSKKIYKDVLVYRNGYKLSTLDKQFITALCEAKRRSSR